MTNRPIVRVAFLDVGQGDTTVISIPKTREAVVVDCADAKAVLNYFKREGIQTLRGIIITHLHLDHYSGVIELLDNLENDELFCERFLCHQPRVDKKFEQRIQKDDHSEPVDNINKNKIKDTLRSLKTWMKQNPDKCNDLTKQPHLPMPLPDVIELLHPQFTSISEMMLSGLNNTSGVLSIKGMSCNTLLMSDLEATGWEDLRKQDFDLQHTVLKFPHHGSWKETDLADLLDKIQPELVVISVGTSGEKYNHPNLHVLTEIAQRKNITLYCTQATVHCDAHIRTKQMSLVEKHQQQQKTVDSFLVLHKGCQCAGTVIVDLGESLVVLQPEANFHSNLIDSFATPRCRLSITSSKSQ